jgi:two-component system chemotaxis response regulator CheB
MPDPRDRSPETEGQRIIVVGGSAGGLQAVEALLAQLDPALPATIFVVLHQSASSPGTIPTILARSSGLPIVSPTNRSPIRSGQVYVAPPNAHLFLERGRVRLLRGPLENSQRPSIDTLFRSAAVAFGPRVVGVVLSGTLDDGTAGLEAIKACGGIAVVQLPEEAAHPDMPANALEAVAVDHCLPVAEIARLLGRLASDGAPPEVAPPVPERLKLESEFALLTRNINDMEGIGPLAGYVCPACNGPLWKVEGGHVLRFRCHVGHAFSAETLLAEQGLAVERALVTALRLLEERARAGRQLARRGLSGRSTDAHGFQARARELDETAAVLRRLVVQGARLLEHSESENGASGAASQDRG